jgi:hypothetical protein
VFKLIEIIKELKIEVSKPNIFQAIVAKQYDMNTRFIKATFVDGADTIYIPADPTVKAIINAERPDGQSKGFDGVVNEDGTVTVPLHSWMLELDGNVICDISIIDTEIDDNKKLTTTSFTLLVEKAAYGGSDATNDPQYDVIVKLVEDCNKAKEAADEALEIASNVVGVYVGTGDMPDRYNVQIDPSGEALAMDNELSETSENPVKNSVITKAINAIKSLFGVDYIVEMKNDAAWHYRKWNSGYLECWIPGFELENVTFSAMGSVYQSPEIYIDLPNDIYSVSDVSISCFSIYRWVPGVFNVTTDKPYAKQLRFRVLSALPLTEEDGDTSLILRISIKGTWKKREV